MQGVSFCFQLINVAVTVRCQDIDQLKFKIQLIKFNYKVPAQGVAGFSVSLQVSLIKFVREALFCFRMEINSRER